MARTLTPAELTSLKAKAASGINGCRDAQARLRRANIRGLQMAVKGYEAPTSDHLGNMSDGAVPIYTYQPCDMCENPKEINTTEGNHLCRECAGEIADDALSFRSMRTVNDNYPRGSAGYVMGQGQWRRIHPKRRLGLAGIVSLVLVVLAVVLFGEAGNVVR